MTEQINRHGLKYILHYPRICSTPFMVDPPRVPRNALAHVQSDLCALFTESSLWLVHECYAVR